jgi:predicted amidohydrolase
MVDPYGVTVAEAAEDREELIVGEIRRDVITSVRSYMPLLEQRREELYGTGHRPR